MHKATFVPFQVVPHIPELITTKNNINIILQQNVSQQNNPVSMVVP
jgi:hypothetical protein